MKVTIKKLCQCYNKNIQIEPDTPITEIEFETFEDEELEPINEN